MSNEKICQQFLRAAARTIRKAGLARGIRLEHVGGRMCMLGAMDHCGITISHDERRRIEGHVASLLPIPADGIRDAYNHYTAYPGSAPSIKITSWNNMIAFDAEEVAAKLDLAAEAC